MSGSRGANPEIVPVTVAGSGATVPPKSVRWIVIVPGVVSTPPLFALSSPRQFVA